MGTNLDSDNLPEAREVLVFMIVRIHSSWKISVGYFVINDLSATQKKKLVRKCLEFLNESGVVITSLTSDGTTTIAEKLRVNLNDHDNLKIGVLKCITGIKCDNLLEGHLAIPHL